MEANYETSPTHSIPVLLKNRIDCIIKSLKEAGLNTVSPEDIEDVPLYMNIIEYLGTDAFCTCYAQTMMRRRSSLITPREMLIPMTSSCHAWACQ